MLCRNERLVGAPKLAAEVKHFLIDGAIGLPWVEPPQNGQSIFRLLDPVEKVSVLDPGRGGVGTFLKGFLVKAPRLLGLA